MTAIVIGLVVYIIADRVVSYLREREMVQRHEERIDDLLNRKLAPDFPTYGYHTTYLAKLKKIKKGAQLTFPEMEQLVQERKEDAEEIGPEPPFISQVRPQPTANRLHG